MTATVTATATVTVHKLKWIPLACGGEGKYFLNGNTVKVIGTLNSLHTFRKRHFEVMLCYFKGKERLLAFHNV